MSAWTSLNLRGLSLASRSFSQAKDFPSKKANKLPRRRRVHREDFDVEATRATAEAEARPLERVWGTRRKKRFPKEINTQVSNEATSSLSVASASQAEHREI